jgi:hypothetical protein
VSDFVVKNPATGQPNDFDAWGRGQGGAVVVEPPLSLDPTELGVLRPAGRCFEAASGLMPAAPDARSQRPPPNTCGARMIELVPIW